MLLIEIHKGESTFIKISLSTFKKISVLKARFFVSKYSNEFKIS